MRKFTIRNNLKAIFPLICLALIALAGPALAVDGVREINQACVAAGCFAGDDPGFPVEITLGGSHILTSDLDVRNEVDPENVTAITISVPSQVIDGVLVDLNGFRILGPNECFGGSPVTQCINPGTGIGIDSGDNEGSIRNGFIHGMGDDCIQLSSQARVESMQIRHCGGDGIQAATGGLFLNNIVSFNGGNGISAAESSLVMGNSIDSNMGSGIAGPATLGYGNNVISRNGSAVTLGTQIGSNLCDAALCP